MEFTSRVSEVEGHSVVTASGELDAHSAPSLGAQLDALCQSRGASVIVDLTAVDFIDSTGLGVMVTALKHVREADGTLDVVTSAPRVLKVFALTGLDVVIPLHATLGEALASS